MREEKLKIYRDLKNSLDTAREEGWEEGREEAFDLIMLVVKLTKQGKNEDEVAKEAGIPIERLREILLTLGDV